MATKMDLRISLGSNSSGDYEVTVLGKDHRKGQNEELKAPVIKPMLSPSSSKKKRKKSNSTKMLSSPRPLGNPFQSGFENVKKVFECWTEEEKKEALWNLMVSMHSGEAKFQLLGRLEQSLKRDPMLYLPGEIGVYLLSFLERKDLCKAAQVSTLWKNLAYDSTLLLEKIKQGSIYCLSCNMFLGREIDIISRKYRLDYSLAFIMKSIYNVELGQVEDVEYSNGSFKIAKACCKSCKSKIGVKYLESLTPGNEDKKNTFLVKKKALYFPGEPAHHVVLVCKGCKTTVAKDQDIIDWNYVLRGGEAYLFSRMFNIYLGTPTPVTYTTGNYTVADCLCSNCDENLGVKYIEAPTAKNAYKVGAYLVEKPKLQVVTLATHATRTPAEAQLAKERGKQKGFFNSLLSFIKK